MTFLETRLGWWWLATLFGYFYQQMTGHCLAHAIPVATAAPQQPLLFWSECLFHRSGFASKLLNYRRSISDYAWEKVCFQLPFGACHWKNTLVWIQFLASLSGTGITEPDEYCLGINATSYSAFRVRRRREKMTFGRCFSWDFPVFRYVPVSKPPRGGGVGQRS